MLYKEALEYLTDVKVTSRYDLRQFFSPGVVRRLLKIEKVDWIDLATGHSPSGSLGSVKYKASDLFGVNLPYNQTLFIIYLRGENDALIQYLADLIKKPLNIGKVKAISHKLRRLGKLTRMKVIERAGYKYSSHEYKKFLDKNKKSGS